MVSTGTLNYPLWESASDIIDSVSQEISTDPCVETVRCKFKPVVLSMVLVQCQELPLVYVVETLKSFKCLIELSSEPILF